MAGPFNIVAALQLQAPTNVQSVVSDIQRRLSGITASINLQINNQAQQTLSAINSQLTTLQSNLQATQSQVNNASNSVTRMGSAYQSASTSVQTANTQIATINATVRTTAINTREASNAFENFGIQAGLAARRYSAFLLAGGAIVGLISDLRAGISEALRFQHEMVRLAQTGQESLNSVRGVSEEITRLATNLGVSSRELAQVSVVLRQAGLSADDTRTALEALAQSALAPSFENMTQTAEGFIAVMSQFHLTAQQAAQSLGSINAVANAYAVESRDLIDAIRRTGGAFHAAGGNINELIALFTAVRSTTRESAESIGTALRTIFTRLERTQTVDNLRQLGVELTRTRTEAVALGNVNLEGTFVGPYEAIRRISTALRGLNTQDLRFAAISEELGGYRQISKVIPLLQEFGKAQAALQVAQAGTNSLTDAASRAQESFLVKITKVREEFLALIRTVTESRGFSIFLDMVLSLTKGFTQLAQVLTPLIPVFAAFATFKIGQNIGNVLGGFAGGLQGRSPNFANPNAVAPGSIRGYATGGVVPGEGNSDTVPANLTPGEYVIRKQAAQRIGYDKLHRINQYASGGFVRMAEGGIPEELIGRGYSRAQFIANPQGGHTYEISGQHATAEQITAFIAGTGNIPGVAGQARGQSPLNPIGREGKKTGEFIKGEGGTTGYLRLPLIPGDNLGFITMDVATKGGTTIRSIGRKSIVPGEASEASLRFIDSKHAAGLEGPVSTLVVPSRATGEFQTEVVSKVSEGINSAFQSYFVDATGQSSKHNFHPSKSALDSITGYLFESYLGGLTGIMPQGGTASFDFPPTPPGTSALGNSEFAHAVFPKGLVQRINLMDIKASAKSGGPQGLLTKYVNNYVRHHPEDVPPAAAKATGGIVDSVPALLTPGEFVVSRGAAQHIGYHNLDAMNKSGVARFATGGLVGGSAGPGPDRELEAFNILIGKVNTGLNQLVSTLTKVPKIDPLTAGATPAGVVPASGLRFQDQEYFQQPSTFGFLPGSYRPPARATTPAASTGTFQFAGGPTGFGQLSMAEALGLPINTYQAATPPTQFIGGQQQSFYSGLQKTTANRGALSGETQNQILVQQLNRVQQELLQAVTAEVKTRTDIKSSLERQRIIQEEVNGRMQALERSVTTTDASGRTGYANSALGQAFAARTEGVGGNPPLSFRQRVSNIGRNLSSPAFFIGGSYLAQTLQSNAGTPEDAVRSGNTTGYRTNQALGGALTGALAGAAIGSAIPLVGTALGALGGAAIGLATSFVNASNEISRATVQIAQTNQNNRLAQLARTGAQATAADLAGYQTAQNTYNTNIQSSGPISSLRALFGYNRYTVSSGEQNQAFQQNLQPLQQQAGQYLQARAQALVRQAGPNANPTQILQQLYSNPQNQQLATTFGTGIRDFDANLRDTTIAHAITQEHATAGQNQATAIVQNFDSLVLALRSATSALSDFQRVTTVSTALASGQITAGANRNIAENLNQLGGPNPAGFNRSVQEIGAAFGPQGSTFTGFGLALQNVRQNALASLPGVLEANSTGTLQSSSIADQLRSSVQTSLGGNRNEFTDQLLNVMRHNLSGTSEEQLRSQLISDPTGVIDRALGQVSQRLISAGQEIGHMMQEAANQFGQALMQYQTALQRAGQALDRQANLQVGLLRTQNQVQGIANYTSGIGTGNIPLAQLQQGFNFTQTRLAATGGLNAEQAFNPQAIGARILQLGNQAIEAQHHLETLPQGGPNSPYGQTQGEIVRLTSAAANLQQALGHLTDVAQRNAVIEERLGQLRRDEEGRMTLAERFLTGDSSAREEMMQGRQTLDQIIQNGQGFSGLGESDIRQVLNLLNSSPNIQYQGRTFGDWRQTFLAGAGPGLTPYLGDLGNAQTNRPEMLGLGGQLIANAQTGVEAAGVQANVTTAQANAQFATALQANTQVQQQLNTNLQALATQIANNSAIVAAANHLPVPGTVNPTPSPGISYSSAGGGDYGTPHAAGGPIFGQPHGTDTVPAWLTPGEYVINRESAQANIPLLSHINRARGPIMMAVGGNVPDNWVPLPNMFVNPTDDPNANPYLAPNPLGGVALADVMGGGQTTTNARAGSNAYSLQNLQQYWDSAVGAGLSVTQAAQAVIGRVAGIQGASFGAASLASTVGRTRSRIGQQAPGLSDQYNWTGTAQGRIKQIGGAFRDFAQRTEAQMGTAYGGNFSGFFGRQQVVAGAAAPDVATTTFNHPWVLNAQGGFAGRYVGAAFGTPFSDAVVTNLGWYQTYTNNPNNPPSPPAGAFVSLASHPDWHLQAFAGGGLVRGSGATDATMSLLTAGEYVLNSRAVKSLGVDTVDRMNAGGSVGYYQGGGEIVQNNLTPGVGSGTNNFGEDVTRLQAVFSSFSSAVANLANVLTKIPPSIQLAANHNVNVNINGVEAFSSMEGTFKEMITRHVDAAINNMLAQRFPEVGQMTSAETSALEV